MPPFATEGDSSTQMWGLPLRPVLFLSRSSLFPVNAFPNEFASGISEDGLRYAAVTNNTQASEMETHNRTNGLRFCASLAQVDMTCAVGRGAFCDPDHSAARVDGHFQVAGHFD